VAAVAPVGDAQVARAAHWGTARGARGLLVTDWGDRGHLQPPSVSWAGFLTAADLAWNADAQSRWEDDFGPGRRLLARQLGSGVITLASAAAFCGCLVRNASALSVLLTKFDQPFPPLELATLTIEGLRKAIWAAVHGGISARTNAPRLGDGVSVQELSWAGELMRFACFLGEARLEAGDGRPLEALAAHKRAKLAEFLAPLIDVHRRLWLERSRPGGLDRSARWLERILEALQA